MLDGHRKRVKGASGFRAEIVLDGKSGTLIPGRGADRLRIMHECNQLYVACMSLLGMNRCRTSLSRSVLNASEQCHSISFTQCVLLSFGTSLLHWVRSPEAPAMGCSPGFPPAIANTRLSLAKPFTWHEVLQKPTPRLRDAASFPDNVE